MDLQRGKRFDRSDVCDLLRTNVGARVQLAIKSLAAREAVELCRTAADFAGRFHGVSRFQCLQTKIATQRDKEMSITGQPSVRR